MDTAYAVLRQRTNRLGFGDLPSLMAAMTGDEKHSSAATSTLDVLWVLYDRILRVDPERPEDPLRDRFLLSKGHGPMAFYAVLAARGFIATEELRTFGQFGSRLGLHPDSMLLPGVEIASGSLGHGLPIAAGMALALRTMGNQWPRVFCLVGDAELDEGSNHEAIAVASWFGLDNLNVIVIDNRSASHGWPGGIERRFETEGWVADTVDGRDHEALSNTLWVPHPGGPRVVVAHLEGKD